MKGCEKCEKGIFGIEEFDYQDCPICKYKTMRYYEKEKRFFCENCFSVLINECCLYPENYRIIYIEEDGNGDINFVRKQCRKCGRIYEVW